MAADAPIYDKILYVAKDRLDALAKAKSVTSEMIDELMVPEDLPDKAILVPVDISGDAFGEVYDGHEELVEKIGAKGVADAVLEAMKLFESTKTNFKEAERPIPMTVKDWKGVADSDDDDDDDDDEEADEDGEEAEEEEGEEEDEEVEPDAKKKKTA